MPTNRNTLLRLRTIDQCLCRRHRKWTLEDLREACEDALREYEGIGTISLRTIQRDIELMRSDKLGYAAPIVVRDKKYYAYEDPEYSISRLPLSPHDVAELNSAMDIIRHYQGFGKMSGEEDVLTRMRDSIRRQGAHAEQTVYIDTNLQLQGLENLGRLHEHIMRREPVAISYKPFQARGAKDIHLSPYILKEHNNRWFLIGWDGKQLRTLALDRIQNVRIGKGRYTENVFFDPAKYFSEMIGVTRELDSQPELVTIKVDADQTPYVLTKPLHHTQQVTERYPDGSATICVSVILNHELTRLLLGYGHHIEVIAPKTLRRTMANNALVMAAKYQET